MDIAMALVLCTCMGFFVQDTPKDAPSPTGAQSAPKPEKPNPPAEKPGDAAKSEPVANPPTDRADDEKAIRELIAVSEKAFNDGDAQAYAAVYTDDAVLTTEDNTRLVGRDAIAEYFDDVFTGSPGDTLTCKTESLTFLGPDTAEEEGTAIVVPADAPDAPETTRYVVLYVKRDGHWLQARERDEPDRELTPHDRLKALEWMIGEWVNESAESVVFTTCKWADNENFLLRDYTVKVEGRPVMSGSQRIGWDPLSSQFKSWVFDSEGGYGEGLWTRNGNQWMIKATGVRPDGKVATATQTITRLGPDQISWQSTDRTLSGEARPDVDEYVLVRKPPEPATPKDADKPAEPGKPGEAKK